MSSRKRSTIYFDHETHRALRMKAEVTKKSISTVVNEALRHALSEDAADLDVFEKRGRESSLDFEGVVEHMRRTGRL